MNKFPIGYKVKHNGETYEVVDWGESNSNGIVYDISNDDEELTIPEDELTEWSLEEDDKCYVCVLTAFGSMIDTVCEVFDTYEDAKNELEKRWMEIENQTKTPLLRKIVCKDIWKTDDPKNQNIEWQIHEREF